MFLVDNNNLNQAITYSLLVIKLRGLSPRVNCTDRATAACRRSQCQLLQLEGRRMVSATDPHGSRLLVIGILNSTF
jgi:hypothetical protein